jgi:hypothetical protein
MASLVLEITTLGMGDGSMTMIECIVYLREQGTAIHGGISWENNAYSQKRRIS